MKSFENKGGKIVDAIKAAFKAAVEAYRRIVVNNFYTDTASLKRNDEGAQKAKEDVLRLYKESPVEIRDSLQLMVFKDLSTFFHHRSEQISSLYDTDDMDEINMPFDSFLLKMARLLVNELEQLA